MNWKPWIIPSKKKAPKIEAEGRKPSGVTINHVEKTNKYQSLYATPDGSRRTASLYFPISNVMHAEPLAFFLTWTCYGTWLPGDDRGWTKWHQGDRVPQPLLADWCKDKLVEKPVLLDEEQRKIVHETIAKHCEIRNWPLHAVNCRSNHCHCVVTASDHSGEQVRDQLKSWCTRKLKEHQRSNAVSRSELRQHWWTRKGSVRQLFDEESLDAAIIYTLESQDVGGSKEI